MIWAIDSIEFYLASFFLRLVFFHYWDKNPDRATGILASRDRAIDLKC